MLAVGTSHWLLSRHTYRYMVTFDVTQSMDVEDLQLNGLPASRLAVARAAAQEALLALPCGSQIGWSLFADYRVLVLLMPVEVCGHYEELLASLEQIDGRMRWANASRIATGVTWALRTAKKMEPPTHVVFLTDGQEAPPLRKPGLPPMADITPGEVGGLLIGVGGQLAARIPKTDSDGNPAGFWTADEVVQRPGLDQGIEHLSRREDDYLQSLATAMGLGYVALADPTSMKRAMLDTRLARRQAVETDLRWLPAGLALLLLVWRFLPERRSPVDGRQGAWRRHMQRYRVED